MFTILPGTTMTLRTVLPSSHLAAAGSARACAWMASLFASAATVMLKRGFPLNDTAIVTEFSLRYSSLYSGHVALNIESVLPRAPRHNSSDTCGANGASNSKSGESIWRERHFCEASSLTHIIKADTDVLNENDSISPVTFLISLCRLLRFSAVGSLSSTRHSSPRQ